MVFRGLYILKNTRETTPPDYGSLEEAGLTDLICSQLSKFFVSNYDDFVSDALTVLDEVSNTNLRVHYWFAPFKTFDPGLVDKDPLDLTYKEELLTKVESFINETGVAGLSMNDYTVYPSPYHTRTAYMEEAEILADYSREISNAIHTADSGAVYSANITTNYSLTIIDKFGFDLLIPDIYNFNTPEEWIYTETSRILDTVKFKTNKGMGLPVAPAISTYYSDQDLTPWPAEDIIRKLHNILLLGVDGYALFLYGRMSDGIYYPATGREARTPPTSSVNTRPPAVSRNSASTETVNKLTEDQATGTDTNHSTTGFGPIGKYGITIESSTENPYKGGRSVKITLPGDVDNNSYEGFCFRNVLLDRHNLNTITFHIHAPQGLWLNMENMGDNSIVPIIGTGEYQRVQYTGIPPNTLRDIWIRSPYKTQTPATLYVDTAMVEDGDGRTRGVLDEWTDPIPPTPPTNLFPLNMETGTETLEDTTGFSKVKGTETINSTTSEFYRGSRSFEVITPGNVSGEGVETDYVDITPSKEYTVSLMASGDGDIILFFREYDDEEKYIGQVSTSKTLTIEGDWINIPLSKSISDKGAKIKILVVTNGAQEMTYYLDKLWLYEDE